MKSEPFVWNFKENHSKKLEKLWKIWVLIQKLYLDSWKKLKYRFCLYIYYFYCCTVLWSVISEQVLATHIHAIIFIYRHHNNNNHQQQEILQILIINVSKLCYFFKTLKPCYKTAIKPPKMTFRLFSIKNQRTKAINAVLSTFFEDYLTKDINDIVGQARNPYFGFR